MGCRFFKREITVKKDTTYSTVVGIFLSVTEIRDDNHLRKLIVMSFFDY